MTQNQARNRVRHGTIRARRSSSGMGSCLWGKLSHAGHLAIVAAISMAILSTASPSRAQIDDPFGKFVPKGDSDSQDASEDGDRGTRDQRPGSEDRGDSPDSDRSDADDDRSGDGNAEDARQDAAGSKGDAPAAEWSGADAGRDGRHRERSSDFNDSDGPDARPEGLAHLPRIDPARAERLWNRNWYKFAKRVTTYQGWAFACATYDSRYPSSAHESVQRVRRELTRFATVRMGGNMVRRVRQTPERDEIEAITHLLPQVALDAYGQIHSVVVEQVLGPEAAVVRSIALLDEAKVRRDLEQMQRELRGKASRSAADEEAQTRFEKRLEALSRQRDRAFASPFILLGYDTTGMVPRRRWQPSGVDAMSIAFVDAVAEEPLRQAVETIRQRDRRDPRVEGLTAMAQQARRAGGKLLIALPTRRLERGVSQDQLAQAIGEAGLNLPTFAALVIDLMRQDRDQHEVLAMREIRSRWQRPGALPGEEWHWPEPDAESAGDAASGR